jgi:signal transduction histidine kinase
LPSATTASASPKPICAQSARFYRRHPERDGELGATGLGLGLSIVADCVDALKGDIHVESVIGEGCVLP